MRKILVQYGNGANFFIRESLVNAWRAVGYNVYFWDDSGKSAFDAFSEFKPDIFLGSTWQLSRALIKCLKNYKPNTILYADAWGDIQQKLDLQQYPIGVATPEQIDGVAELYRGCVPVELISNHGPKDIQLTHGGWADGFGTDCGVHSVLVSADVTKYFYSEPNEKYNVNIAYVGGYWPFKGRNLDKYILSLTYPTTKWSVRLFGSGWNVVNGLGRISDEEAAKYYRNAMIIPHVVEPHCGDVYQDLPLRYFQVPACGGFAISCPCVGIRDVFDETELVVAENPQDFFDKIVYYLNNPKETEPFRFNAMKKVYQNHTGFHRIKQLHNILEIDSEPIQRFIEDRFYPDLVGICYG